MLSLIQQQSRPSVPSGLSPQKLEFGGEYYVYQKYIIVFLIKFLYFDSYIAMGIFKNLEGESGEERGIKIYYIYMEV